MKKSGNHLWRNQGYMNEKLRKSKNHKWRNQEIINEESREKTSRNQESTDKKIREIHEEIIESCNEELKKYKL